MSHDQKPMRVRAVAVGSKGPAGDQTGAQEIIAVGSSADAHAAAGAGSGMSPVAIALFLVACGLGGGLVAYLPYMNAAH